MSLNFTNDIIGNTICGIRIDEDVLQTLEYMRKNFNAHKLVAMSEQIAKIAPLLWDYIERKEVHPLVIDHSVISSINK